MYILKTEHSFDAAHFLAGYNGKCANIHGHHWRVEAEIKSDRLCEQGQMRGMIVDFGVFKSDLRGEADALDHALLIEEGSLKEKTLDALNEEGFKIISLPFRPTAENFAKYFHDRLTFLGYDVLRTTVYETPVNCASYCAPER